MNRADAKAEAVRTIEDMCAQAEHMLGDVVGLLTQAVEVGMAHGLLSEDSAAAAQRAKALYACTTALTDRLAAWQRGADLPEPRPGDEA